MNKEIPKWLSGYIQNNDVDAIEEAVKKAELKTSGEIVPIIVRQSSTTGHVPLMLIFLFTSIYFSVDAWNLQLDWGLTPWLVVPLNIAIFIGFLTFLSRRDFIKRWLTPKGDQIAQTEQRALIEYYNHRVHHTESSTGILIFLSMMEHRAVVLGDEAISEKLPSESWQKIVETLVGGIKARHSLISLVSAIDMCGEHLKSHFPREANDVDELENHLIVKE